VVPSSLFVSEKKRREGGRGTEGRDRKMTREKRREEKRGQEGREGAQREERCNRWGR